MDEFLRAYLTRQGRVAFYASARNIYLEDPHGPKGFWTRLPALAAPALFVWGTRDRLVPAGLRAPRAARRSRTRSTSSSTAATCPQLERPRACHEAVLRFLSGGD